VFDLVEPLWNRFGASLVVADSPVTGSDVSTRVRLEPPEGYVRMLLRAELFSALAVPIGMGLILQTSFTDAPARATPLASEVHAAVSFAEDVMPILEQHCTECHGPETVELGLNLSTYEGLMAGSDYGTVVERGNAAASLIIDMISSGDMPQDKDPMPAEQLEVLRNWINEGAENN